MAKEPAETDISVPFEIANFPTEYRGYYATKRHNMLAMVQKNRAMWVPDMGGYSDRWPFGTDTGFPRNGGSR
jgi:hypothetical protein